MDGIFNCAIESVNRSEISFCKFISANDAGKTGAHQEGFYIPKNSVSLFFEEPGKKGENRDRFITIKWQNDFETKSRFIYYGRGTRNEYRLTRFGRGFPFLTEDSVGDLLILSKSGEDYYEGYVLQNDDDIEEFFTAFNLSPNETNRLIEKENTVSAKDQLLKCFQKFALGFSTFPTTIQLATSARECFISCFGTRASQIISNPDEEILNWIECEYDFFKYFENTFYSDRIRSPFGSVEELVTVANSILNRRKSRAGKSLEHHLEAVFNYFHLQFGTQVITEQNKKPDFIFPDSVSYHKNSFPSEKLVFLASKTTCKDRWRQILNEAERIRIKYLFTLQQGVSANQLDEMYRYNVRLVVPQPNKEFFPKKHAEKIISLKQFIQKIQFIQNN
jgi:type II restriction enzyme